MRKKSFVFILFSAIVISAALVPSVHAKMTKKYFEALANCDGGGGWVVIDDGANNGGVANVMVLCDGGAEGTP